MPRTTIATTTADWERLAQSVTEEDRERIPQLVRAHAKLARFIEETRKLVAQRNYYEARKQEATRKIQRRLADGRKAATMVRVWIKDGLGDDNEELARFGMKPVRARKRRQKSGGTRNEEGSPPPRKPRSSSQQP